MDSDYLAVAGTRARFFTLEAVAKPVVESGPRLLERDDLVNSEREKGGRDKYSTIRTGINLNPHGSPCLGYDDHRARHEPQHNRRFPQEVASRATSLARQHRAGNLVPGRSVMCWDCYGRHWIIRPSQALRCVSWSGSSPSSRRPRYMAIWRRRGWRRRAKRHGPGEALHGIARRRTFLISHRVMLDAMKLCETPAGSSR
jgi:hypothetical protein